LTCPLPYWQDDDVARIRISTRGRVVVPKAIRDKRRWKAGMRLIVEELPDGVLLKPTTKHKVRTTKRARKSDWPFAP
jgi:AbrB family looped-hinge helix DNA binding protein